MKKHCVTCEYNKGLDGDDKVYCGEPHLVAIYEPDAAHEDDSVTTNLFRVESAGGEDAECPCWKAEEVLK